MDARGERMFRFLKRVKKVEVTDFPSLSKVCRGTLPLPPSSTIPERWSQFATTSFYDVNRASPPPRIKNPHSAEAGWGSEKLIE
jgi:hypothetical protein